MSKFIIVLTHNGEDFWLRSTVWSAFRDKASTFPTREAAQAQLDRARQFMKAKTYKAARIVEDA